MQNILSIHTSRHFSELPVSPVTGLSAIFVGNAVQFITYYAGSPRSRYKKPLLFRLWILFLDWYIEFHTIEEY